MEDDHLAKDFRGNDYRIRFRGATLTIIPEAEGTPITVSRERFAAGATILDGLLSKRTVMVPGANRLSLRLHPRAFQALRVWIEPCRRMALARALRRITVWQVLLGTLFLATSGPWLDPDGAWDVPMALLGGLALSVSILSIAWPRRWIYGLEMVWSVSLSAMVASWVAAGSSSAIWLGISALLMSEAYAYGRLFMFWGPAESHLSTKDQLNIDKAEPIDSAGPGSDATRDVEDQSSGASDETAGDNDKPPKSGSKPDL